MYPTRIAHGCSQLQTFGAMVSGSEGDQRLLRVPENKMLPEAFPVSVEEHLFVSIATPGSYSAPPQHEMQWHVEPDDGVCQWPANVDVFGVIAGDHP